VLAGAAYIGFIPVHDTSEAARFYGQVLGLRIVEDTPFALVVDAAGTLLRITPVADFVVQPFTIAGWTVPDISSTVAALTYRGVQFNRYDGIEQDELGIWTAPGGDQVAWFGDPDGNVLSLTTFATGAPS
jgi:catechol 2,3-dioxygenase-like lactoylglutathione lyase family enzyme